MKKRIAVIAILAIPTCGNAALVERLGGLAYFDTDSNLTWLADANLADTSGHRPGGAMNWSDARSWADGLNVGGVTGWRLPKTLDVGNDGLNFSNIYQGEDFGYNVTNPGSELSNLFYSVLGNQGQFDTSGNELGCGYTPPYCLTNSGPFSNLLGNNYWSETEYVRNTQDAWVFQTYTRLQTKDYKVNTYYAWAVHDGDVAPVPLPAAAWFFGAGLAGFAGLSLRNRDNKRRTSCR